MRILHTADWHLGKKTDDLERLEEQKQILDQIIKISRDYEVDMVIVAGDVYDTLVPSAEAESLLYRTLSELSNNGDTAVIAIAGNHDEPKRMSNASVFASRFGIYLVGYTDDIKITELSKKRNIYATEAGKGYIKFKTKKGEEVVVACLPYPSYYRYKEIKKEGDNFADKFKEWMQEGVNQFRDDTINILTSHLVCQGEHISDEDFEEYSLISSNFSHVPLSVLDTKANYTALGHLHNLVKVDKDKNIYYSGAIMNTTFSPKNDLDKYVIIADVESDGVKNIETVMLDVKKLLVVEVNSLAEVDAYCKEHSEDYVKATLKGVPAVNYEELKQLRSENPNLVTLSVITEDALKFQEVESKKNLTTSEIFDKFVEAKTGKQPNEKVKELFLELMGEDLYEAD